MDGTESSKIDGERFLPGHQLQFEAWTGAPVVRREGGA